MSRAALLKLVRWPGAVTAAGNAAAAFLLAHDPTSTGGRLAIAGAAGGGFLVYLGGVALNDVADAESDLNEHPARPIPSGAVTRDAAMRFGVALVVIGIVLSASLAGLHAGLATAASAALAIFYDFGARRSRVLAAVTLGAARASNAAAGAIAASGSAALFLDRALFPSVAHVFAIAIFAYTTLLTYASTFESRALPRYAPGLFATLLAIAAGSGWALFPRTTWIEAPAIALVLLFGALIVAARTAAETDGPGLGALIRAGVFGFLLLDAFWLFGVGRYDAGFWWILVYVGVRVALLTSRS